MNNELNIEKSGSVSAFLKELQTKTGEQPFALGGANVVVVQFRCSKTGKPFQITLTQESKNHRYQICKVISEPSLPSTSGSMQRGDGSGFSRELPVYQLDFSGWQCPHCLHRGAGGGIPFVHCSDCKELVCGARIRKSVNGEMQFACHDSCGATGAIGTGTIQNYRVNASDPKNLLNGYSRKSIGNGFTNGGHLLGGGA